MIPEELLYPRHYAVGGVYVKELLLSHKGSKVVGHKHKFDHLSLLATGIVKVTVDGHSTTYIGPIGINIKANQQHEILAITDNCLWYCIHAVPEGLRGEALLDDVVIARG